MPAKEVINEIVGAINYWLSPGGKLTVVSNHVDFAAKMFKVKLPRSNSDQAYWNAQGKVYQKMYEKGWVRLAIQGKTVYTDYQRINRTQWAALEMLCIERACRAVDDDGRELMDFRSGPMGESLPGLGGKIARAIAGLNRKLRAHGQH